MGLKKWWINRKMTKLTTQLKQKSTFDAHLDAYVMEAMKQHSDATRTADKLLKAKILQQQARQTLNKIKELDEEEEEGSEEEEEIDDGDIDTQIKKTITDAIMRRVMNGGNSIFDFPSAPPTATSELEQKAKSILTPEQIEMLKRKMGVA